MKVYDVTRVFGLAMIPCFYYFGISATTEECKFSAPSHMETFFHKNNGQLCSQCLVVTEHKANVTRPSFVPGVGAT